MCTRTFAVRQNSSEADIIRALKWWVLHAGPYSCREEHQKAFKGKCAPKDEDIPTDEMLDEMRQYTLPAEPVETGSDSRSDDDSG